MMYNYAILILWGDLMTDAIGKNTQDLLNDAEKSIMFVTKRPDIIMEKGEGMYLWDTEGRKYLDFIGGWAVTSIGHSPASISKALVEQAAKLVNASPAFFNVPMIEFAKLLTDISCMDKVFFASSGAEANEGALKLARRFGEKRLSGAFEIITTINAFHGRTIATMSASGKTYWEKLFEPKVPGFIHVPLNDFDAVSQVVTDKTCAIMLEPIQGEAGVFAAEIDYVKKLRKLCDEKGILLIFDEVQTGIGRTGKMFAYEHYGIEPDIMTLAKGIGGGFPLSALLAKDDASVFEAGDQGGTYSGQPLAMAVGLAVVNEIIDNKIVDNAEMQGRYIIKRLEAMKDKYGFSSVRGNGLLIAFELPAENGAKVVDECMKRGLLINSPQPATIRLMPPLIVNRCEVDEMFDIFTGVLDSII